MNDVELLICYFNQLQVKNWYNNSKKKTNKELELELEFNMQ